MTALALRYSAKPGKGQAWEREFARQLREGRDPLDDAPVLKARQRRVNGAAPLVYNELVSTGRARGEKNPQMRERQQ